MSTSRRKRITFGTVDLPDDEFDARNVKVRVTTLLDQDVLDALKQLAKKRGTKYQTLLNALLRAQLLKDTVVARPDFENRVRKIVREELRKRAYPRRR